MANKEFIVYLKEDSSSKELFNISFLHVTIFTDRLLVIRPNKENKYKWLLVRDSRGDNGWGFYYKSCKFKGISGKFAYTIHKDNVAQLILDGFADTVLVN